MYITQTERLNLRYLDPGDAGFILDLVNDPSWLRYIGDRGVRSLADAESYIRNGPMDMYAQFGFGMFALQRRDDGSLVGICGLIKRDTLPDVDIGYALLPQFAGQGFALEAARACVSLAHQRFGLQRLLAITTPDNQRSMHLLLQLGMQLLERYRHHPDSEELCLYAMDLPRSSETTYVADL
jgi:[ribosomal protein S5]-alanine N-acetyltransferase